MYNLIIYIYQFGVIIASLFNEKVRKMWRGEREAVRILKEKVDPNARYVWFHAASLGEFEQGRPLMEQLRQEHPEYKILLTFFSPSGYEVRKNYEGADIICYLPLDTITNARRFLRTIRPVMAFFIKYEFWYNYLHILKHRNVPVYSVSSIFRPDQIFFRWYGRQYSHVLKCFTRFYVQNEVSRELLAKLHITNVTVVGDTRFDRVLQIKERPTPGPSLFMEGSEHSCKVFVAGSSWQPDEEIFIPFFKNYRDWALIIAPHVIGEEHLQQIEAQLDAIGFSHTRYTEFTAKEQITPLHKQGGVGGGSALIIDCFGLLSSIYRYGDVTYVGGGFGVSIHNTLEAAVWDKPVIFGPENKKFQEAQGLKACGGGLEISGAEDFNRIMQRFISNPQTMAEAGRQAGAFVKQMTGATEKILADVQL
jgi:3-deoxy-D-manno-octulosonic-acid transferase